MQANRQAHSLNKKRIESIDINVSNLLLARLQLEQLFDLHKDPFEENDLIADPANATRLIEMRQRFQELKEAANRQTPLYR